MVKFIPNEILADIMARTDIVQIVGEYMPLTKRGRNFFGLCPFHDEDTPSFSVNAEKQYYYCFGCKKGGNVINFVQETQNLSFTEAAESLAQRAGVTIPEEALSPQETARRRQLEQLRAIHSESAAFYAAQLGSSHAAHAYLQKRGISAGVAAAFGLGYAPGDDWQALYNHLRGKGFADKELILAGLVSVSAKNQRCYDKFHGRLIFPICDYQGRVIAFGGRAMADEEPKYLNSQTTPIYNKSANLYALHSAAEAIRASGAVVVMEGYMDVLTAHQYGVTNAVASLGTAFTDEHIRLLNRYAPQPPALLRVYLCFDGDKAGVKAALASLAKLRSCNFLETRVLMLPDALDPDDYLHKYGAEGWQELLQKGALDPLAYLLYQALPRHDLKTAAGKGALVNELLPAIIATPSQTEQAIFIRQLAKKLNVSEDALKADIARARQRGGSGGGGGNAPRAAVSAEKLRGVAQARRSLLRLAAEDKNIFARALAELDSKLGATAEEDQLIALIIELGADYDYHLNSLFNYIEEKNEGLRNFLLKLLQTDIPDADAKVLAEDYIRIIKQYEVRQRIAEIQAQLADAGISTEQIAALLAEKTRLNKLLREK
ncbi:MAG: DNA primase [Bacillota bacterium]|nr:DNA primase [Bacillota bacterium]